MKFSRRHCWILRVREGSINSCKPWELTPCGAFPETPLPRLTLQCRQRLPGTNQPSLPTLQGEHLLTLSENPLTLTRETRYAWGTF